MSQPTTDYRPMWESLGLDLTAHDALLGAIPVLYGDAYLSQTGRPEGMSYFDFVMSEIHGLRIKELVDHKAAGGTVIGTFCLYVPSRNRGRGCSSVARALVTSTSRTGSPWARYRTCTRSRRRCSARARSSTCERSTYQPVITSTT